jgi:hypothetical protein
MYYEAKIMDGWVWERSHPDRPFTRASAEQAVAFLLDRLMRAEADLVAALHP